MIRSIIRKPKYVILYFALIIIGFLFVGKINKNIIINKQDYKNVYENTLIKGNVKKALSYEDRNSIKIEDVYPLFLFEELRNFYATSFAKAFFEDRSIDIFTSTDIDKMFERNGVKTSKLYKLDKYETIVSQKLLSEYGLNIGDTIKIKMDFDKLKNEEDVILEFKIVDSLDFKESNFSEDSIVVSIASFLDNGFLANKDLKDEYAYFNNFLFEIDPTYNNIYDKVKDKIDKRLGPEYITYTNSRDFYNVIKPIERKIKDDENLLKMSNILILSLSSLILIFWIRSESINILIMKILGQGFGEIFTKYFILFILFISIANACGFAMNIFSGNQSIRFLLTNYLVNIILMIILLSLNINKNILKLYQNMED